MHKLITALVFLVISSTQIIAQTNYIPPQAFTFRDTIRTELDTYFSDIPEYNYFPSLVEHESCISLKHKKCWNSMSELKTKREQGLGLTQITRAYREDGSVRFDTLGDMRNRYKAELRDASWDTLKTRPDIQIRMGILLLRESYKKLYSVDNPMARLQMTDSAYNGGIGDVFKARRACGLKQGCNPNLWFGHVETKIPKSRKPIYAGRSALDINLHHVDDVFNGRLPKYKAKYFVAKG